MLSKTIQWEKAYTDHAFWSETSKQGSSLWKVNLGLKQYLYSHSATFLLFSPKNLQVTWKHINIVPDMLRRNLTQVLLVSGLTFIRDLLAIDLLFSTVSPINCRYCCWIYSRSSYILMPIKTETLWVSTKPPTARNVQIPRIQLFTQRRYLNTCLFPFLYHIFCITQARYVIFLNMPLIFLCPQDLFSSPFFHLQIVFIIPHLLSTHLSLSTP